ncbi:ABC transporter substrate-binding protein [Profundibacter amoris]|uniref:Extracellular solute-binding protein n=1 Tax=Profundibacter amoris TaxID=2171755 RepID=A0A347UEN9_9RHOB|nr:ABC transporter substrate-binding protein [Profundibacter amoris]AXX97317.1 extracellular solute-binding protein [Profundibacter amoris]
MKKKTLISALALSAALSTGSAFAAELNVVCSNEQDWCDLMAGNFEDKTGISVAMVRKSTGETLAQVRAEAGNPKIDVWWGGTGDPHLIAAAEGLTQPSGADTSELLGWAQNLAEISGGRTIGIHLGVLGVAYNADILKEKGIKPPACWKDLTDPQYKGEIQVANPNSSGTAYTELATIVQIFGEDDAFRLLKEIGENVNSYTKSGSAPSKAAARGETGISIGFEHDMVKLARAGFPLKIVSPCEGTGYEVGGVSIITGAKNFDEAKQWVEFVLSAEAQSAGPEVGVFNIPSNSNATIPPEAPAVESIKLIDYDFATYGATDTRERLLSRWDKEVKPGN